MAYWLYCQSCMQWSKSATGLSEDKSCPFCSNLLMKTKPYSVPHNAFDSSLDLPEKQQASSTSALLIEKETIKTSSRRREVEAPEAPGDKSQFQENIEEEKAQEASTAVCQTPETIEVEEVSDEEELEKDEEVVDWELEVDEEIKAEELETYEMLGVSEINEEALKEELKEYEVVVIEEREEDEYLVSEAPEKNLQPIDSESNEPQESPEPDGMRINFRYEKSEFPKKNQKADLSDILEQSGDSPIFVEVVEPGNFELHESAEQEEQVVDRELERDEEVGEDELEEDEDLIYDPAESDACEAVEQFEAGSTAEGINQPEPMESAELVEPLSEQVEFSETSGEKQETSQETIAVVDQEEKPSASDAPDPETAGPADTKASLTPEPSQLQRGEMNQTIAADSSEADEVVNAQSVNSESLEATNELETPEESETPEIIERAADCEPFLTIITDEAPEAGETAESNEANPEDSDQQVLVDSSEMVEAPDKKEEFYESPNRAKMTRVHERYIEMIRRTRNPIQPQL